ncbi:MAG: DHH family phosphoesterase [Clostridia bacterium]|nr:DHH family phosphoesterase [Clostridia bacterium]
MKKLWKIYDFSLPFALVALIFSLFIFMKDRALGIIGFVLVIVALAGKFVYYKTKKEKLLNRIKAVSDELDFEQGKAFETLTVPCCVVEEDGDFTWFNPAFREYFNISDDCNVKSIGELVNKESIEKILVGRGYRIRIGNQYFAIYSNEITADDEKVYLLYFFDETRLRQTEKEFYETRPSIMLFVIDNIDEIYQNFKDSECTAIVGSIEQLIEEWVGSYGGLCRKFSSDRIMVFVEERGLQRMITDKFSILDKVREFTFDGRNVDITLSVGVGKDDKLAESHNAAKLALDMAQSRGGDQVAVKHEVQYKFYGGVSAGHEKKNKAKTRLIAKSIAEIIRDSENVVVMGHRFSDFDSFGSAVGVFAIARHFEKRVNIVLNRRNTLAAPLVDRFVAQYGEEYITAPEKAAALFGKNTLLVVVDTHKREVTEAPELLDLTEKVMVIDHHRKSVGFIENTVMFYHMPNSSSASEMVSELVQYVDTKPVINQFESLALFAGILLDTRNFIIRAGVRTFEAAAYLRSRGANTVETKKLFSNDMEIFRHRNLIIDSAKEYRSCAISVAPDNIENVRLVTSQAADEMLNIEGVKASFVLYRNGNGVNISARSYGEINVQLVMESMGGGGHQTMSACQLNDIASDEAVAMLEKAIDEFYENN